MSREIVNARIRSTTLGVEDHGIFTAWLNLDYGGSGQGFGGWALDGKPVKRDAHSRRPGTAYGCEFIRSKPSRGKSCRGWCAAPKFATVSFNASGIS